MSLSGQANYGIISGVDGLKKIMYGVTDFARMRAENGYFIDRTDLIPELEKTSYTVFLRQRIFLPLPTGSGSARPVTSSKKFEMP